jgi:hypothetical protein
MAADPRDTEHMRFSRRTTADEPGRSRPIWTTTLVGTGEQTYFGGQSAEAIFVGDGDGVLYANLRFRAYSLTDGREFASVRTGTTVRCLTRFEDGDLLVATDHRLHRLNPLTLAEHQRWERGVPEFGDSIALQGMTCLVANWRGPNVSLVDLQTGRAVRRSWVAMPRLVESPDRAYLIASQDGEVSTIDVERGERIRAFKATSARDAVIIGDRLWIIDGRPKYGAADKGESGTLRGYDIGSGVERTRLQLPGKARRLCVAGPAVWALGSGSIVAVNVGGEARVEAHWKAPEGEHWSAVDPLRGLAFSSSTDFAAPIRMTCHVLEGGRVAHS